MTTSPIRGARILIAEEDPATRTFLSDNLAADGYHPMLATSRRHALSLLAEHKPHLVVCDLNGETLSLLDAIREADGIASRIDPETPMIVLCSQRPSVLARVRALQRGSDDVVAKPFSYPELALRIAAVLRRGLGREERGIVQVGPLVIDPPAHEARLRGTPVSLSKLEFALLRVLASEPTRVFTKVELMRDVWGSAAGSSRTLDSHACRLRAKLGRDGDRFVHNVWGVGYRLVDGPAEAAAAGEAVRALAA